MSETEVAAPSGVSEGGESAEAAVLEIEKKITDAFLVFDIGFGIIGSHKLNQPIAILD